MQVDHEMRIPGREGGGERARLGGLELHVVAIEIQPLHVLAAADAGDRTVLRRPVHDVDGFVAVDVVDRRDQDHHAIEERPEIATREAAHQDLNRFLALDFAAVDVGEEEHDWPPGRLSAGRATAGFDNVTSGIVRPSSVVPKDMTRTSGDFAASAVRNAFTSSRRLVSSKFVRSGRVCNGSGFC